MSMSNDGEQWQRLLQEILENQRKLLAHAAMLIQHQQEQYDANREALRQAGQTLGSGARQISREVVQTVETQAHAALERGAGGIYEKLNRQFESAGEQATFASATMSEQRRLLSRTQGALVWKSLLVLLIGACLVIVGTTYWARANLREAQRHQVEAELLRAYNAADVTLCDGRLCANVEARGRQYGDRKQYRLVKPR